MCPKKLTKVYPVGTYWQNPYQCSSRFPKRNQLAEITSVQDAVFLGECRMRKTDRHDKLVIFWIHLNLSVNNYLCMGVQAPTSIQMSNRWDSRNSQADTKLFSCIFWGKLWGDCILQTIQWYLQIPRIKLRCQMVLFALDISLEFRRKRLWYCKLFNLVVTIWCIFILY